MVQVKSEETNSVSMVLYGVPCSLTHANQAHGTSRLIPMEWLFLLELYFKRGLNIGR
jgi:hypothetical protein